MVFKIQKTKKISTLQLGSYQETYYKQEVYSGVVSRNC